MSAVPEPTVGEGKARAFLEHWGDRRERINEPILGSWFDIHARQARLEAVAEHRERLREVPHEHVWVSEEANPDGPCASVGCGSGSRHQVCDVCGLPFGAQWAHDTEGNVVGPVWVGAPGHEGVKGGEL